MATWFGIIHLKSTCTLVYLCAVPEMILLANGIIRKAMVRRRETIWQQPRREQSPAPPPAPLSQGPAADLAMGKGDPNKPRGKMSSYAYFVQTCREEHKKKHPDSSVNFAEFSRKCSERWKTMSSKEKGKFEEMAKGDKARYDREMKNYVPPKGEKKGKKKDPNAPKRPPSAFFLFCSEHRPKIKNDHPGLSIGDTAKKLGEMWSEQSAKDKQPYEQKAAKLKEKYEKDIAAYRAKSKSDAGKKGPGRPAGSKKKAEPEEEEEEEEDEEEEEEDEDEE
ncbi:high mobility group protein B2 [Patagioenas fasciata monilis]|uniref:High mobility group protein B2 n=17 Tax=Neognathae TaxID=8825 RepID=A0A1V4JHQ2_PATFA|nr:high mobility group protein B2 [Patagioenas fasciata monilis]